MSETAIACWLPSVLQKCLPNAVLFRWARSIFFDRFEPVTHRRQLKQRPLSKLEIASIFLRCARMRGDVGALACARTHCRPCKAQRLRAAAWSRCAVQIIRRPLPPSYSDSAGRCALPSRNYNIRGVCLRPINAVLPFHNFC